LKYQKGNENQIQIFNIELWLPAIQLTDQDKASTNSASPDQCCL